jgi:hypothetical protein
MKKLFLILSCLIITTPRTVFAQTDPDSTDTQLEDTYFSGFIEDIEAEKKAKQEAEMRFKDSPKILKLQKSQLKELEKNKTDRDLVRQKFLDLKKERMKPEEKIKNIIETYESAPLGLNWNISPDKMKQIGYELEQVELEDYPNSYIVKNYQQKNNQPYENVIVSFGENNKLWRINAQTSAQKDESTAKETLKLYHKYFEALSEKYGNANEHFSAFSYETKTTEVIDNETVTKTIIKENPKENPDFLNELQTGKAELYATFHNNNVGVTLSVYVNENGLGQVVLDYKNLPLMKKEKETFINNL